MSVTLVVWLLIAAFLVIKSFGRPSYAIGVYMLTFFAHPQYWWWGDPIEGFRWNFFSGVLVLGTLLASSKPAAMTREHPMATSAVPVLAFMAANVLVVHLVLAVNSGSSLGWVIARLKFILLFFLVQYAIRDKKDYRIVAMSIALGMAYIGWEATINERGSFSGGRLEGIGAAGVTSSNQLASLLVTGLPLAVTLLFVPMVRSWKVLTLISCGLAFNVVLMCNSRGAFLGLLLGGVVFLLMASGPAKKQSRRVLALAALATFLLLGDPQILQRFMTTFTDAGQRDSSAQSRIVFWTAGIRMAAEHPLGSGGNSFSEGLGWRYMPNTDGVPGEARAIHNGFVTELVDWGGQGFVLMMLFISAVWLTLRRGRKAALASGDAHAVMVFACIAASLMAWLVSSFFGDYLNDEWGFWMAALAYSYLRVHILAANEDVPESERVEFQGVPMSHAAPRGFAQ